MRPSPATAPGNTRAAVRRDAGLRSPGAPRPAARRDSGLPGPVHAMALAVVVAAIALVGGACGGSETTVPGGDDVPAAGSSSDSDGAGGQDGGSAGLDADGSGGATGDGGVDEQDVLDGIGLDDATIEGFSECLELATAYGTLYLQALGGPAGAAEALTTAQSLKSELPEELHGDIDVIAAAIAEVAQDGLMGGTAALDSAQYKESDARIQAWLEETCA